MRAANFVEETTTSIAGTNGDGAVTLSQITSRPRFSTVFGTPNTIVRYVIEDTVNFKYESGIGAVDTNVLTRTLPQVTWDGTTFTDIAATALQFGSSPTSGNIRIRMAPVAENAAAIVPQVQSTVAGDSWHQYQISAAIPWGSNTGVVTSGRKYYFPYKLERAGILSGAQFEVTTLGAGGNMKWALYCCGSDGLPAAKIVDFVTTSVNTTGVKTDTATGSWSPAGKKRLSPGWYFIGAICDVSFTARMSAGGATHGQNPLGRQNGYGAASSIYIAGTYASGLPAVPNLSGGTLLGGNTAPGHVWFGLKLDIS